MRRVLVTLSCLLMTPALAFAEEATEARTGPIYERGGLGEIGLVAGGKIGIGLSQPFSEFGTSFVGELELGYLLPFLERSIEAFASLQYAAPSTAHTASEPDPRLPGDGLLRYEITEQTLMVTLGGLYRLPLPSDLVRPYAALGLRLFFTRAGIEASGGEVSFGDSEETATDAGFYGAIGAELFVGPGAILAEIQLSYASLDGFVLRDTSAGALNLAVGYRLFF